MKTICKIFMVFVFGLFFLIPAGWATADDTMTVVIDSQNQSKAQKWVDYLVMNEITVEFCEPAEIGTVKTKQFITIIGGIDDQNVKKIITEVVGADKVETMARKGTKELFLKEDVWTEDQKVLIFTGIDADAANQVRVESRDTWMPLIAGWFDLDEGPGGLKAY